jgi:outer membrane lipoprotein-sorting protein
MRFSPAFAVLAAFLTLPSQAQPLEEVLAKMDRAAAGFRGITASVRKVTYTAVIKEEALEKGTMTLFRPKPKDLRMLIEFREPDPRSVAFSGRKVQIYYPKLLLIQEYDLGKQSSLIDQFLLLGFGTSGSDLRKSYDIQWKGIETVGGSKAARLELVPKQADARAHVRMVELWIGEGESQPVQQKIHQPSRDYVLITYSDLKVNPTGLSESSVRLNAPKNAKIERPQKN